MLPDDDGRGGVTRRPPEGGRVAPLAPPGRYTVRLSADGVRVERPLELRLDPASEGTRESVAEQTAMLLEIRARVDRAAALIDALEWTRASLHGAVRAAEEAGEGVLAERGRRLAASLREVEGGLFDLRLTGGTAYQDALWWPRRLWSKLHSLAGYLSGTDHRPTEQAREVHALYGERLADLEARWEALRGDEVPDFNQLLERAGLPVVATGPAAGGEEGTGG